MREATLSDLGAVRPRKKAAGRASVSRKSGGRSRLFRVVLACIRLRAVSALVTTCFAAIMVGIVLNATVFQKGHHPAPLFVPPAPAPTPVVAAPQPAPPAPVRLQAQPALPPPLAVAPEPVAAPALHAKPSAPPAVKPKDGIGALLREQAQTAKRVAAPTPARPAQHSITAAKSTQPVQHVRPGSARTGMATRVKTPETVAPAAKTL